MTTQPIAGQPRDVIGSYQSKQQQDKPTGLAAMTAGIADKWTWTDAIRFLIRDCPVIALLILLIVNLPEIQKEISSGYQQNADKLRDVASTHLEAAKIYQANSERRDRDLREMNERLITELKTYHESMVHFLLENRLKVEALEDANLAQPPNTVPRVGP